MDQRYFVIRSSPNIGVSFSQQKRQVYANADHVIQNAIETAKALRRNTSRRTCMFLCQIEICAFCHCPLCAASCDCEQASVFL